MQKDNITLDEQEGREHLAHPERDEQDIDTVLENMEETESPDFQETLLDLRNNLDNFIRRRVNNHNTHIGLTIDPRINTVEIDGENYEVVGERFFELNQFDTSLGDTGMVQWTALAPENSWDVENPMNRGEHAVAQDRNIEGYRVSLDGEELSPDEIRALSKDVRIAERSQNNLSPDAPEWIARYDSVDEILEEEEVSREEVDEELRKSEQRNLITEDYNITLKGLLSFIDADARGFGSLEDSQGEMNIGDIQPENLPIFGSTEGSKSATGETVVTMNSGDETVSVNRFDVEIDFETGEIIHEDNVGQDIIEKLGDTQAEDLRNGISTSGTLAEFADIFIPEYSGEEAIQGEMLEGGIAENWVYRLIEEELAEINNSEITNFRVYENEMRLEEGMVDEILGMAGYESVSDVENELAETLNSIKTNEQNDMGALTGQSAFTDQIGLSRYRFDYDESSASAFAEHIFESTDLDRTVLNDANLSNGDVDYGLFHISLAELALIPYKDRLDEMGVDLEAGGFNSSFTLPEEVQPEVRDVIDYLDENDLVRIEELERFSELQISFEPEASDYDSLRECVEDRTPIHYEELERNNERGLKSKAINKLPFLSNKTDEFYLSVNPRRSVLDEVNLNSQNDGISEFNAEVLMEDLEDVEGVQVTQGYDTVEDVTFEENLPLNYEIDVELEEVSINPDQQISLETEFDQHELIYKAMDSVERASKAINPFNGEDIPYSEVVFDTSFEYN